jgi:ATP-dependent helicase/nuclease subunit A
MTNTSPVKILKASAGSGKTFNLTAHYISLLFKENTHFSQILAITFTNKATAEMKHRILSVLESLASNNGEYDDYKNILQQLNPQLSAVEISLQAQHIYRQILHHYGQFAVSTIDGFVQKIIRSFSYELEIGSSYRLEMNLDKVKKDLASRLNKVLNDRPDLLKWVINYAREQIENGKHWNYTNTLLELSNELFKERYQPFHDAIKDLKKEDRFTVFQTISDINREKIKSFESDFATYFTEAKNCYIKHAVDLNQFQGKTRNPIPKLGELTESASLISFYEKLVPFIDAPERWQAKGLSGQMQSLYDELNPILKKIHHYYQENAPEYYLAQALKENIYYLNLLQEMGSLLRDYREDNSVMLISESQTLLREINKTSLDNTSFIWEKVGTHFKHLLFDEFQDTSSNQWSNFVPLLLNMLAEAEPNTALADHLIVGDIKQSIYRWRSGDWTLLDNKVVADLGKDLTQEDSLQENYRSLENIIDFNNFLYSYGPKWLQEELNNKVRDGIGEEAYERWWQKEGFNQRIIHAYDTSFQQKPLNKSNSNRGGEVTIKILPIEKGNRSSRQNQTKEHALTSLGNQILEWIQTGKYLPRQIGILVRTNKEAQDVIEHLLSIQQSLTAEDKFNVISGEALMLANNRAIKLIINSLTVMITNSKEAATFKANCLYLFHQKENEHFDISNNIWFNLADSYDINVWGSTLPSSIKENWDTAQQRPFSELTELLIRGYGLDTNEADIPYLLAFKDLIAKFTSQGEQSILSFLNYWKEEGIKKALPAGEGIDAIEILTIHKSKGLAFDVVMIPFCSWSLDANHLRDFWVNTANTSYDILKAVPVKYNSNKIGKSSLYRAYFEEMLFNYLDALNMLYVATTRTIRELYITAPEETSSPSLIADLLINVLKQFHDELNIGYEQGIVYPNEEHPFEKKQSIPAKKIVKGSLNLWGEGYQWNWSLSRYPISEHLNHALNNQRIRTELLMLGEQDANVRLGLLLHDLLSKITYPQEISHQLTNMQAAGFIKKEEVPLLEEKALLIFDNQDIKEIFGRGYKSLNEQSIINQEGKVFRPDKILFGPSETIILDFKFTGKKNDSFINKEHINQVKEYRNLLLEMGYPQVRGYLFYAFFNTLVPVQ